MTSKPCKRGNLSARSASGHCLCVECKAFRNRNCNSPKKKAYKKKWLDSNRDKVNAYGREYTKRHPEKRRAAEKSWKERNADKVKEYNRKSGKKWSSNNKGTRAASVRARQIAKLQRTPPWADLEAIAEIYREAQRITAETGIPHEVDHIYPLQGRTVSGLHVSWNLQIIPRSINRSKGNKLCVA